MKKIGIITYHTRHLKTEQVLMSLHEKGYRGLDVIGIPFVYRKPRDVNFQHRPDMTTGAHSKSVAEQLGYNYIAVDSVDSIPLDYDVFVITGAGILPANLVTSVKTVNAHPGLIPTVRGLDSFKWAIHDGMPLGVTLHLADAEVDAGEFLAAWPTPIFPDDTIEQVARRHYEMEIRLMANFLEYLETPMKQDTSLKERPARMRMSAETEAEMLKGFDDYRNKFEKEKLKA